MIDDGRRAVSDMWALDLDERGRPDSAHLIVRTGHDQRGEVRTAACGQEFTAGNHPRGWWTTEGGRLPLQAHAIHCGNDEPVRPPPHAQPKTGRECPYMAITFCNKCGWFDRGEVTP